MCGSVVLLILVIVGIFACCCGVCRGEQHDHWADKEDFKNDGTGCDVESSVTGVVMVTTADLDKDDADVDIDVDTAPMPPAEMMGSV